MAHGFKDSGIRLNTWIAQKNHWTIKELDERNEYLMNQAITIWPLPSTDYIPEEKQFDIYTLEEEEDLTSRQISKFTLKNTEQPVKSWIEMFQKVIQILYAQDKVILTKLALSKEKGKDWLTYFDTTPDRFTNSFEIGDGLYVSTNTSTQTKLSILKYLFKLYNEDPSDLIFYLREEKKEDNKSRSDKLSFSKERHLKNQKYWTYALEKIKKGHEPNGPFSKISPSKDNWINGYFGVSGFNLCCVANKNGARVEVYLSKNKEINKKAFDDLYSHKEEIESILKTPLEWKRGDNIKSSKVFIELQNVNIDKESDWPEMATFHTNWTKKFYEVIVPYLKKKE